MAPVIVLAAIFVLILIGGFCSVAETVVLRISRVRAHHLAQERKTKSAARLVRIVEDPAPYLNVLLLFTLVSYVTGAVLAAGLAIDRFGDMGQIVAIAGMTLVIFVLGEVAPRTFAVQRLEQASLLMARPTYLVGRVFQPLGKVLIMLTNAVMLLLPGRALPKGPFVTEDEIKHMVDVAEEEEEIEEEERELIHSIFEFGDTVVREVMVPRTDMVAIKADASLEEALEAIVRGGYSRIPIFEGDTDNIVGVLYAK
ncbi:MAG: CNNM domain-containing protein, partial [Actinomycetota bacterium]|nr:CNNM domain-containing protein [Actinomycetota bacterium]